MYLLKRGAQGQSLHPTYPLRRYCGELWGYFRLALSPHHALVPLDSFTPLSFGLLLPFRPFCSPLTPPSPCPRSLSPSTLALGRAPGDLGFHGQCPSAPATLAIIDLSGCPNPCSRNGCTSYPTSIDCRYDLRAQVLARHASFVETGISMTYRVSYFDWSSP